MDGLSSHLCCSRVGCAYALVTPDLFLAPPTSFLLFLRPAPALQGETSSPARGGEAPSVQPAPVPLAPGRGTRRFSYPRPPRCCPRPRRGGSSRGASHAALLVVRDGLFTRRRQHLPLSPVRPGARRRPWTRTVLEGGAECVVAAGRPARWSWPWAPSRWPCPSHAARGTELGPLVPVWLSPLGPREPSTPPAASGGPGRAAL